MSVENLQLTKEQTYALANFLSTFSPEHYESESLSPGEIETMLAVYIEARRKQIEYSDEQFAEMRKQIADNG